MQMAVKSFHGEIQRASSALKYDRTENETSRYTDEHNPVHVNQSIPIREKIRSTKSAKACDHNVLLARKDIASNIGCLHNFFRRDWKVVSGQLRPQVVNSKLKRFFLCQ